MQNKVSKFEKELSLLFSKKFFFKEPSNNKIILYAFLYFILNLLGIFLDLWFITSLFSTFYLCYVLGAKGYTYFLPIGVISVISGFIFGNLYSALWLVIHIFVVLIIYLSLINRFPKILLLLYITSFLFFSTALFLLLIIKTGYLEYNPEKIKIFFDNYINNVMKLQPDADYGVLALGIDYIKIHIPVVLFIYLLIYSLLLLQNTLIFLSKEKVIIPVFPKFSKVTVGVNVAKFYLLLLLVQFMLDYFHLNSDFSFVSIFLENLLSLVHWIFILNGLFTCYFFFEQKNNKKGYLTKTILFIGMFFIGSIFEVIGILDSLFKIRQYYLQNKGRM